MSARARSFPHTAPAIDVGELDLTPPELKQLWWFLDGAIMALDTREHLWRSWGLCSRHAWGYAVAEIEVRGGKPFSTSILYEDLTRRAADAVGRRRPTQHRLASRLASNESCFTCDFLAGPGKKLTIEIEHWRSVSARVNARRRTSALVSASEGVWRPRACRLCLGGDGLPCRPHLLQGAEAPGELGDELHALAGRLKALAGSMTLRRTPIGTLEEVAWIEALGWFGGWDYPSKLRSVSKGS